MTAPVLQVRNWRTRAACRSVDPDLFFAEGTAGPAVAQIADAKQVCQTCQVRTACLNWAVENFQQHGVWGGMDEQERHLELRRRQRRRRGYAA